MSTSNGSCRLLDALPEELLLKVFRVATDSRTRDIEHLADLPPFESLRAASEEAVSKTALRTKLSLAHTSSFVRLLSLSFLYEDVWIHHGAEALLQMLRGPDEGNGFGKYVRRIVIPHSTHCVDPDIFKRIVGCCPDVRVISRPLVSQKNNYQPLLSEDLTLSADVLRRLIRIDWNNVPSDDVALTAASPPFIWSSPSLRVLTLGSRNFRDFEGQQINDPHAEVIRSQVTIDLPNVHTVQLRTLDALGDPFSHWYSAKLTSLRRAVLEAPAGLYPFYEGCLAFYGRLIQTIEFGSHVGFLRIDAIALALFYCPNVTELFFPVFNTMPVRKNPLDVPDAEYRYYKVERVVMHGFSETDASYQVSRSWMMSHLAEFLDGLSGSGTRFTALKTVILYGPEWEELLQDSLCQSLMDILTEKKIEVDRQDHKL